MSLSNRGDIDDDVMAFAASSPTPHPLAVYRDLPRSNPSRFRRNSRRVNPLASSLHDVVPNELVLHILFYLDAASLAKVVRVSKSWCVSHLATHNLLWEPIFREVFDSQTGRGRVVSGFSCYPKPRSRQSRDGFLEACLPRFRLLGDYIVDESHPECFFRRMRVVCYWMGRSGSRRNVTHSYTPADPVKSVKRSYLGTRGDFSVKALKDHVVGNEKLQREAGEKVVFVGDGAVGKTCLLTAICKRKFNPAYTPTIFDNMVARFEFLDSLVALNLWDTAGEEDYDSLRCLSYDEVDVFILCYDITNPTSFKNIKLKWHDEVMQFSPQAAAILCGCKLDLRHDLEVVHFLSEEGKSVVSKEEAAEMGRELRCEFAIETSAKEGPFDHVSDIAVVAGWMSRVGAIGGSESKCGVM